LSAYTNENKSIDSEAFPATINKHLSQVIETNKRLHRPQKIIFKHYYGANKSANTNQSFENILIIISLNQQYKKKTIQHIKGIPLSI